MKDNGKYLWTTKVTSKGQMLIPKESRDIFDIKEGETLILLGDKDGENCYCEV